MEDELAIELCMRGYHICSEATELLCERKPRNTAMPSCGKIFRTVMLKYLLRSTVNVVGEHS